MYRIFTPHPFNVVKEITELKSIFGNAYFLDGNRKGQRGTWIVKDIHYKGPYSKREVTCKGLKVPAIFFGPETIKESDLSRYEVPCKVKIPVTLASGFKIFINPAIVAPAQVFLFSDPVPVKPVDEYGATVFDFSSRIEEKEKIMMDDPQLIKIARLALKSSYDVFPVLFDSLNLQFIDLDNIVSAALGGPANFLEETV